MTAPGATTTLLVGTKEEAVRVYQCVSSLFLLGRQGRGLDGGVIKGDIWVSALVTELMH